MAMAAIINKVPLANAEMVAARMTKPTTLEDQFLRFDSLGRTVFAEKTSGAKVSSPKNVKADPEFQA